MGSFSWITHDTHMSILIDGYGPDSLQGKTYYMWDNKGNCWTEPAYLGYGVFGGKDYYILLAEMNNVYDSGVSDDKKRDDGIDLDFGNKIDILFPNFTEHGEWKWKNEKPIRCPNQGAWQDDWE